MEMTFDSAFLSVRDKVGDVMQTPAGDRLIAGAIAFVEKEMHMHIGRGMLAMAKNFTVEKVFSMAGEHVPQGLLPVVNAVLQQIPRAGTIVPETTKTLPNEENAYSVYDSIDTLLQNDACKAVLTELLQMLSQKLGMPASEEILTVFGGFTVHALVCAAGEKLPADFEAQVNEKLQVITK